MLTEDDIKRIHAEVGLSAVSVFPSGTLPQVAINHKYMFPLYAACEEMGLPILLNVGIPGPRIPMETQKVEHLDEVCWFFPELKVVMRHGAEPWEALAVKLMLKWPNLYYSTSAFAPTHYPKAIIDYANTRGADKIIYAGYFPMGLSLDRIMSDMQHVPFAGSPPALAQVMGGQVPLMFDGMATSKRMVEAGKVQAFGVAAKKRSPHLPNVPTLAEQGYPELDFSNWVGIIVASGVPSALVQKVNAAVDKAAASPKVKDRLLGAGFDLGGDETSEQMVQSLRAEFERNAAIVKTFDIKLNQ